MNLTQSAPFPRQAWLTLFIIVVGSAVLATVFIVVTQGSTPLYFTPGIIGFSASFILSYAVWEGRVRGLIVCLLLGILMAALIFGFFHVGNYLIFRQVQLASIASSEAIYGAEANVMLDGWLRQTTGSDGFVGYLKMTINNGMLIRSGTFGSSNQVTGSGLLFHWLTDLGFILLGTLGGAWFAARRPFCEHCNRYYGRIAMTNGEFGLTKLGWVSQKNNQEIVNLLRVGHFESAGALLKPEKSKGASEVMAERCPTCDSNPVAVSVFQAGGTFTGNRNLLIRQTLNPQDFSRFTAFSAIQQPKSGLFSGDTGWFLTMMLLCVFLIAGLVLYGLI